MAVDWSKFDLIDDYEPEIRIGPDAIMARFLVTSSDFASYAPAIGDGGLAGTIAENYKVQNAKTASIANGYLIVTVRFVSTLAPNRSAASSSAELDAEHLTDVSSSTLLILPKWYFLQRRALFQPGQVDLSAVPALIDYTPSILDSDDVQYTAVAWAAITTPPISSPFSKIPDYDYVNRKYTTTVAKLTFYETASGAINEDWKGVAASGTIPSDYDVPERTTNSVWRAIKQRTSNITTRDGSDYVKVVRWLERVPNIDDKSGSALRWNPATNGGAMTW